MHLQRFFAVAVFGVLVSGEGAKLPQEGSSWWFEVVTSSSNGMAQQREQRINPFVVERNLRFSKYKLFRIFSFLSAIRKGFWMKTILL